MDIIVSALLCERWGLDRSVVAAVKYHHDPTNTNLSEYDAIVATCVDAANYLANYCGINLETLYGIDTGCTMSANSSYKKFSRTNIRLSSRR